LWPEVLSHFMSIQRAKVSMGFNSLFRIVRRVCDNANEEDSLDAIGALNHKALSTSLDELLIHQMPP
jgi:hypothetical protein